MRRTVVLVVVNDGGARNTERGDRGDAAMPTVVPLAQSFANAMIAVMP